VSSNPVIDTGNERVGKELSHKLLRMIGPEFLLRRRRANNGTTYITVEVSFDLLHDLWVRVSAIECSGFTRRRPPWNRK